MTMETEKRMLDEVRKFVGNELLYLAIKILPRSVAWRKLVMATMTYFGEAT